MGYLTLTDDKYYAGPPGDDDLRYLIHQKDVYDYLNNIDYITAFDVWHKFSLNMGFPYAGGWADQPFRVVEIISLFENAFNQEEHFKQQERENKPTARMLSSNIPKTLSS